MEFKTGDKVVVTSGKSKGKEGTITKVLRSENKVIVEGVNMIKNILNQMVKQLVASLKWKLQLMLQM